MQLEKNSKVNKRGNICKTLKITITSLITRSVAIDIAPLGAILILRNAGVVEGGFANCVTSCYCVKGGEGCLL